MDMPIDFYGRKVGNQFYLLVYVMFEFLSDIPSFIPSSGSGPGLRFRFEVGTGGSPGQHTSTAYRLC